MSKDKSPVFGLAIAVFLGVSSYFVVQNMPNSAQDVELAQVNQIEVASDQAVAQIGREFIPLDEISPAAGSADKAEEAEAEMSQDVISEEGDMRDGDEAVAVEEDMKETDSSVDEQESSQSENAATEEAAVDPIYQMEQENPMMGIRAIGLVDAPIVIEEFSSFTCPHCASFHTDVLPALKEKYIDTGKVRLIFRDYPLNAPSLMASGIARCFPEDQYYDFMTILFETQEEWAVSGNPDKLLQTAKLAGLSGDLLQECRDNKDLVRFILAKMQRLGKRYDIKSTPTFVFNGGEASLRGSRPVAEFSAIIEELLEKQNDM